MEPTVTLEEMLMELIQASHLAGSGRSTQKIGNWWSTLADYQSDLENQASPEFRRAWEGEVRREYENLKENYKFVTVTDIRTVTKIVPK